MLLYNMEIILEFSTGSVITYNTQFRKKLIRTWTPEGTFWIASSERLGVKISASFSFLKTTPRFRRERYNVSNKRYSFPIEAKDKARDWIKSAASSAFSGLYLWKKNWENTCSFVAILKRLFKKSFWQIKRWKGPKQFFSKVSRRQMAKETVWGFLLWSLLSNAVTTSTRYSSPLHITPFFQNYFWFTQSQIFINIPQSGSSRSGLVASYTI